MVYTYDALKTHLPEMVELLVDSVRNRAFLDWEVKEQIEKVEDEISEYSKTPQNLLMEAIHATGYSGPHGYTLMASESAVERLNSIVLEDFVAENYAAPHTLLAAAGVEHDELLKIAEPLLSDMPKVHRPAEPKPVYVGGDYRRHAEEGTTHFALAFEVPGGWLNQKEVMTLLVIQSLMGGGGSFLAGGPRKGMHSRLYLRVLNGYPQMQMCSAFGSIYKSTGLFGIQATAMGTSEDIGKQILTYGEETCGAVLEGYRPGYSKGH